MNIQCDNVIVERRPDIVIANKMEKTAIIIDRDNTQGQDNNSQGKGENLKVLESPKKDLENLEP